MVMKLSGVRGRQRAGLTGQQGLDNIVYVSTIRLTGTHAADRHVQPIAQVLMRHDRRVLWQLLIQS